MSNPLTFLSPFRYDAVRTVLVIQTGPLDRTLNVMTRLRTLFPGCRIEALLRPSDATAVGAARFDAVTVRRWTERAETMHRLRQRRFDGVALQLTGNPTLWLVPLLLRTEAVLVFNEQLDYFPLKAWRALALARHVGAQHAVRRMARRAVVWPGALFVLLASTTAIHLRLWRRRARAGWTS